MFFVTLLITLGLQTIAHGNYNLLFVQMLYRHGDRAPKQTYPTDPNPADIWTLGLGQLTEKGRRQHYELGTLFRQMYKNFFTTKPTEVNALSDINNRCLNSAESNFASFFSPTKRWQFIEGFNWQPIPIKSIPFILEEFLGKPKECPAFDKALKEQMNSPSSLEFNRKHQELYDYLSKYSGSEIKNYLDVKDLYEILSIENKYNLIIPEWARKAWYDMEYVYNNVFPLAYNSTKIQHLRAGPVLGLINKMFHDKINGKHSELKFRTYSAHDDNVAVVLAALGIPHPNLMFPYCTTLIFELFTGPESNHFIRLLLLNTHNYNKYEQTPKVLVLSGCQEFCPFSKFLEITEPYAHFHHKNECEA